VLHVVGFAHATSLIDINPRHWIQLTITDDIIGPVIILFQYSFDHFVLIVSFWINNLRHNYVMEQTISKVKR